MLRQNPRPTALLSVAPENTLAIFAHLMQSGLKLPDDIAVVGAGNVQYCDVLAVPLTTVDQGTCRIGALAAELLIARISSKRPMRPKKILIPPRLVERESTRR